MAKKPADDGAVLGVESGTADDVVTGDAPVEAPGPEVAAEAVAGDDAPEFDESGVDDVVEPEVPVEAPFGWDLVGDDGRRIVRFQPKDECRVTAARILDLTGEETRVVPSEAPTR